MHRLPIRDFFLGEAEPLALISGPCVIEDEALALRTAHALKQICLSLHIPLIYKSSYDKANRSSLHSFRGPGIQEGLRILQKVKEECDLPVVTDVHTEEEARAAAEVCDMIQIPAFLCRQTDLLLAAAKTQAAINVKKGQFMAPWDMGNVVEKILSARNHKILLTERGTSFGYNNLIFDPRSIPILKQLGFPVCFDASHSLQLPGGRGSSSGGQREFLPHLAKAAVAAGANCLFIESHPDPANAKSDRETVLPLEALDPLLRILKELHQVVCREQPCAAM